MDPIMDRIPGVKMLFFVGREIPAYAEDCCRLVTFCSSSAPPVALTDDDDAAIYFSSGTTGFPKAILHKHRSLISACMTEQHHHGQTRSDVFLCIPPLYHTGAKMHWFGSLVSASKAVLLRGVKPEWILRAVTEEKCTIVWLLVPWCAGSAGGHRNGADQPEPLLLGSVAVDAHRRATGSAQPDPPVAENLPAPSVRYQLRPFRIHWSRLRPPGGGEYCTK